MHILPDIYMITGDNTADEIGFLNQLNTALSQGISLVQFRAKHLCNENYIQLAKKIAFLAKKYHAKLILNCDLDIFHTLNADGLQLTSARLHALTSRPLAPNKILLASCHNQRDLLQAEIIKADGVTLSPVLKTKSHPKATLLGWDTFQRLATSTNLPIFALGGVGMNDLPLAKKHGAMGIAAISAIWDLYQ